VPEINEHCGQRVGGGDGILPATGLEEVEAVLGEETSAGNSIPQEGHVFLPGMARSNRLGLLAIKAFVLTKARQNFVDGPLRAQINFCAPDSPGA
jgi:hypothetical protein